MDRLRRDLESQLEQVLVSRFGWLSLKIKTLLSGLLQQANQGAERSALAAQTATQVHNLSREFLIHRKMLGHRVYNGF